MPCKVPAQKINTSVGMQSLQCLGVEFHVLPVSNCPNHFKQSLLESPNSSFSCKNLDFSAVCSHDDLQYPSYPSDKEHTPEKLCLVLLASPCAACNRHNLPLMMIIHLFQ